MTDPVEGSSTVQRIRRVSINTKSNEYAFEGRKQFVSNDDAALLKPQGEGNEVELLSEIPKNCLAIAERRRAVTSRATEPMSMGRTSYKRVTTRSTYQSTGRHTTNDQSPSMRAMRPKFGSEEGPPLDEDMVLFRSEIPEGKLTGQGQRRSNQGCPSSRSSVRLASISSESRTGTQQSLPVVDSSEANTRIETLDSLCEGGMEDNGYASQPNSRLNTMSLDNLLTSLPAARGVVDIALAVALSTVDSSDKDVPAKAKTVAPSEEVTTTAELVQQDGEKKDEIDLTTKEEFRATDVVDGSDGAD
jgi:hypothetical protein